MSEEVRVAVLGAGITGLCAADLLSQALGSDSVVVLEASDKPGGFTRTECCDGFVVDHGPNGFLDKEPLMLQWVDRLGLTPDAIRANEAATHRFLLLNGRLIEVAPPPRFLLAPLLSIPGRLRLLCEPFVRAKRDHGFESIWDFAARRIGREAADKLVSAMVLGVFGGDAKRLSLEHCFPRMAQMEREYGGLVKAMIAKRKEAAAGGPSGPGGVLTTFTGGIGAIADRAAGSLGDRLRLNTPVARVTAAAGGYRIELQEGANLHAEAVVVATPAHSASPLVAELDSKLADALARIDHAPLVVVCSGYRRENVRHDMDGFGFLIPPCEAKRALGCIWTSTIFSGFAPEGWILARTMFGGATDPKAIELSDPELLELLAKDIHPILKIDSEPEFVRIYRHPKGIPQYYEGHDRVLHEIESAEARHKGLYLAGNGYRGVSLNDCVVSAHRAVDMFQKDFN